jgi:hypothetical protein
MFSILKRFYRHATAKTNYSSRFEQIYPQADATLKPEFQQTKSLDFETKGKTDILCA